MDSGSVVWEQIGAAYPDPNDPTKLVRDVRAHARLQVDDLSSQVDGVTQTFALSKIPSTVFCLIKNGQWRFDFTWDGSSASVTSTFTVDLGDSLFGAYFAI